MQVDILIAVEDPGAANFILDVPSEIKKNNFTAALISFGYSKEFFRIREISSYELEYDVSVYPNRVVFLWRVYHVAVCLLPERFRILHGDLSSTGPGQQWYGLFGCWQQSVWQSLFCATTVCVGAWVRIRHGCWP